MTEENPLTIAELGAYTNNSMNREGIKKLVDKVNEGGGVEYTAGDNISISDEGVISATDTKYTAGNSITITQDGKIELDSSWEKVSGDLISDSTKRKNFLKEYSKTHDILIYANDGAFLLETPYNIGWEERYNNLRRFPLRTIFVRNSEEYIYSLTEAYIYNNNFTINSSGLVTSDVEIDCADADGTPITSTNITDYITKTGTGTTAVYTFVKPFFVHIKFISGSSIEVAGMCYGDNYPIPHRRRDGSEDTTYLKVILHISSVYERIIDNTSIFNLSGQSIGASSAYFYTFPNTPTGNNWYMKKKLPNYVAPTP